MKKTQNRNKSKSAADELKPEYRFDYSKGKPNRFAAAMSPRQMAVVLEPDVAAVFNSSKAVNVFLRSAISAMPDAHPAKRGLTRR